MFLGFRGGRRALQHILGIGFTIAAVLVLTGMAAMVKYVSPDVPTGEIMFARSFFALPVIIVWMMTRKEFPTALKTRRFTGQLLRSALGGTSMIGYFLSLKFLQLPDVTAIQFMSPLLTLALAALLLGEVVRIYRWSAVAIGFAGVILILWPHLSAGWSAGDEGALGAVLAVVAASLSALAMVQVRHLTGTETTASIVFYFSLTVTVMGLATLPFGWIVPDLRLGAVLVSIGLLGGIGQILLTQSYRHAQASLLAPFDYTAMIWSVLFGYLIFGDVPLPMVLVGAAIVIAAGLAVIWRERQLGIQRDRQRRAGLPPV